MGSWRFRSLVTGFAAAVVLSSLGVLLAGQAAAHADLVSSDPADGAVLTSPPPVITLTFSDPLFTDGVQMSLVAADGSVIPSDPPQVSDAAVSLAWPPTAGSGTYEVGYRVVSEDGHPVSGAISFTIEEESSSAQPTVTTEPAPAVPVTESTSVLPLVLALLAALAVAIVGALAFGRRKR